MNRLSVTLIDVGVGDSLFLEFEDSKGNYVHGLIDSNDDGEHYSSLNFIDRHFNGLRRKGFKDPKFFFVLLSHAHSDHSTGLKRIINKYGTKYFWYSQANDWGGATLIHEY